jgi:hypothetical protein
MQMCHLYHSTHIFHILYLHRTVVNVIAASNAFDKHVNYIVTWQNSLTREAIQCMVTSGETHIHGNRCTCKNRGTVGQRTRNNTEAMETMFPMRSMPRLYNQDPSWGPGVCVCVCVCVRACGLDQMWDGGEPAMTWAKKQKAPLGATTKQRLVKM